jgi:uncharacterized delta-60 repeat protein
MQFDGKSIHYANINDKQTLWRQNPNGSLDTSFGTRGKVVLNQKDHVGDMTVAPDGKILVYYWNTRPAQDSRCPLHRQRRSRPHLRRRWRCLHLPHPQTFFQFPSSFSMMARSSWAEIGTSTSASCPAIYRLNSNGTVDNSFGVNGLVKLTGGGYINDLDIRRSDNRIVAAGITIARLESLGTGPQRRCRMEPAELPQVANIGAVCRMVPSMAMARLSWADMSTASPTILIPRSSGYDSRRYPAPNPTRPFKFSYDVAQLPIALQPDGKVLA